MNKTIACTSLLIALASIAPAAAAEHTGIIVDPGVIGQAPVGASTYPLCVWWVTYGFDVWTPGASVNRPPVHVTIDPVYVIHVPGSSGKICVGDYVQIEEAITTPGGNVVSRLLA